MKESGTVDKDAVASHYDACFNSLCLRLGLIGGNKDDSDDNADDGKPEDHKGKDKGVDEARGQGRSESKSKKSTQKGPSLAHRNFPYKYIFFMLSWTTSDL